MSRNKEWRIAIPLLLFMFLMNVIIRSTDYERLHYIHTIFDYALFLVFWAAVFISLVRSGKTILANISFFFSLIVLAEIVFFFVLGMPFKPLQTFPTERLATDPKLAEMGYLPVADQLIDGLKMIGEDTVFSVQYNIDSYHRRIIPGDSGNRAAYALFFGCSVTYGFGVEDVETIPYFFQQNHERFKAYNYAYNGYGSQNVLAHLQREKIETEIKEREGVAIYIFLWSHIFRSIGDMATYSWGWRLPYYESTRNGVVRKGNFADDRKWVSFWYERALQSQILKYFQLSFPRKLTENHLELTADIIQEASAQYLRRFGNDHFYVLIYPEEFAQVDQKTKADFLNKLQARNIKILDGYEKVLILDDAHRLPGDPHPNGLANEKIGRQLAKDIK